MQVQYNLKIRHGQIGINHTASCKYLFVVVSHSNRPILYKLCQLTIWANNCTSKQHSGTLFSQIPINVSLYSFPLPLWVTQKTSTLIGLNSERTQRTRA